MDNHDNVHMQTVLPLTFLVLLSYAKVQRCTLEKNPADLPFIGSF